MALEDPPLTSGLLVALPRVKAPARPALARIPQPRPQDAGRVASGDRLRQAQGEGLIAVTPQSRLHEVAPVSGKRARPAQAPAGPKRQPALSEQP